MTTTTAADLKATTQTLADQVTDHQATCEQCRVHRIFFDGSIADPDCVEGFSRALAYEEAFEVWAVRDRREWRDRQMPARG